ncbi:putative reverse transcriptase domain-containing protein [Tanacetum coccineum]
MRQRRWIQLYSDYDCEIRYHLGKANVSRLIPSVVMKRHLEDVCSLQDEGLDENRNRMGWSDGGICYYMDRNYVEPNKMYYDLRDRYWWPGMKKDIAVYKGVVRFGKKGKLAPRFVRPFEIIESVGPVAYRLRLPDELNGVHDTFHVLNLKKCLADPTLQVPLDEIQVYAKLNFVEEPVEILEREFKKLKRSRIAIVNVRWNSKRGPEFTWEREDQMKLKYPYFFSSSSS